MHEGLDQFARFIHFAYSEHMDASAAQGRHPRRHHRQTPRASTKRDRERMADLCPRCVPYCSTLTAGAARIDLDGHVADEVTVDDEQAPKSALQLIPGNRAFSRDHMLVTRANSRWGSAAPMARPVRGAKSGDMR
jgi:hypothetical protein